MVELKIQKIGDSLGVILPDEVVHNLNSAEGKSLFLVEGTGREYRLTPSAPDFEKKMAVAESIASRYRNTLRDLSK